MEIGTVNHRRLQLAYYDSPCGRLAVGAYGGGICICDWTTGNRAENTLRRIVRYLPVPAEGAIDEMLLEKAVGSLDDYFKGNRRYIDLPLTLCGTPFQRKVWEALRRIPYGMTSTYKDIAAAVSLPRGVRAVGAAIGANPLSILIPCHRIIGADGSLTGYAGGIEAKKYLLGLEQMVVS